MNFKDGKSFLTKWTKGKSSSEANTSANVLSTENLSGGNAYQVQELNKVQKALDEATMCFKSEMDGAKISVKTKFEKENYDLWRLLNFQADYYCNVFEMKSNNSKLNNAIQIAKRTAFIFGKSGIYKMGETLIPIYIKSSKLANDGCYLWLEVSPAIEVLAQNSLLPKSNNVNSFNEKLKNTWDLKIYGEELNNVAILKWDANALGAWWKFLPFMNMQKRMLIMLNVEGYSLTKKFNNKVANPNTLSAEVDAYFDETNPFTYSSMINGEMPNKITSIELGGGTSTQHFTDFYREWLDIWYSILGRRFNNDFKKERNITDEVQASQSNFDILENEHKMYLENFARDLKLLTTFEIELEGKYVI